MLSAKLSVFLLLVLHIHLHTYKQTNKSVNWESLGKLKALFQGGKFGEDGRFGQHLSVGKFGSFMRVVNRFQGEIQRSNDGY